MTKETFDEGEQYNRDWLANELALPQRYSTKKLYKDQVLVGWRSFFAVRTMYEVVSVHESSEDRRTEFDKFLQANMTNHNFLVRVKATDRWPMASMFVGKFQNMPMMATGRIPIPFIISPPMYIHLCESPQHHPVHGKFVAWSTLYGR